MRIAALVVLSLAPLGQAGSPGYFIPVHRVAGIGVARDDVSGELAQARAERMIQSETFGIMREALAVPGAKRITSNSKLQALFRSASARSGVPASLIEAIAYLESWGDARAQSPSGPRGIMQISEATARTMGLKVTHATRYRIVKEKVQLASTGRRKYRTVTHKIPYVVPGRDDRLSPERAIPAAARYIASLEQKYGGRDWAIFAYHCGQGCVNSMIELTRQARGIPPGEVTVPRMFFSASPSWNRELYQAVQQEMQRDFSPTYYFRVMRAEQLLALYRRDPKAFLALSEEYRNKFTATARAPYRLSVWLKREDLVFHNEDDVRANAGNRLVEAPDRPAYFGYALKLAPDAPATASAAAVGTLAYVAFETRRLFDESHPGAEFVPLPVSSLVESEEGDRRSGRPEALGHASGQVFDIEISALPPQEIECLRLVLDDLGWDGLLGFIEEGRNRVHIGCSPGSRDFFADVYQDAALGRSADHMERQESPAVSQDPHIGELN
jgi:hypothetical protein